MRWAVKRSDRDSKLAIAALKAHRDRKSLRRAWSEPAGYAARREYDFQETAQPRRAHDVLRIDLHGWVGRLVPRRRQVLAGSVTSLAVVPGHRLAADVIQMPLSNDDKRDQSRITRTETGIGRIARYVTLAQNHQPNGGGGFFCGA